MDSINYDTLVSEKGLFVPPVRPGNPFLEIWRNGAGIEKREGYLEDSEIEEWIDQTGRFELPSALKGKPGCDGFRMIFGCPRPAETRRFSSTRVYYHGHFFPFVLPFSQETFTMLLERCKLPKQILDLKEHRSIAGHSSMFEVQDDTTKATFKSSLSLIRVQTDTAVFTAFSHNPNTGITTGIVLQVDEGEVAAFKEQLTYHMPRTSHRMLLRTITVEQSLLTTMDYVWESKLDVMDLEHQTGQHTWDVYTSRDQTPKPDAELSRIAHGLKIRAAVVNRRIDSATICIDLLLEVLAKDKTPDPDATNIKQWLENLKTQAKMAKIDAQFLQARAENQVGAVYNRLQQRDNLTAQKISEAANRDSSAMKSLAVLGALFYPGTFVAALFALDCLAGQPLWMYWVVTAPLTFIVVGSWFGWTYWRSEHVRAREAEMDRRVTRAAGGVGVGGL